MPDLGRQAVHPIARAARGLHGWVRRPWEERGTQTYVTVLAATSVWSSGAHDRLAKAALLTASTNLDGMRRQPVTVLLTSASWMYPAGAGAVASLIVVAVFVLAPVEARIGTRRWLTTFAAGHVGATIIVAAGLSYGIEAGWIEPSAAYHVDVGWSYGAYALAAVAVTLLRGPRVRLACGALLTGSLVLHSFHPNFTDVGHDLAAGIGLVMAPWCRRASRSQGSGPGPGVQPGGRSRSGTSMQRRRTGA